MYRRSKIKPVFLVQKTEGKFRFLLHLIPGNREGEERGERREKREEIER
jgi:hypothetical protein